jgi:phospholipid/cholesterol/gamma-HCH transport system substrate-binding protein
MDRTARRLRLGLFVLGTAVLFVGLLGFILQNSLNGQRATYFILFGENVKGMVVGSKVNFQGVPIGAVRDIRFQDGKTVVELRVDPTRASIQDLTTARMDRLLVTGQVTIELEGYGAAGKPLAPGSFIQTRNDPLSSLTANVPEVVDRVLARADPLLGDDNQARVRSVLDGLDRAVAGIADGAVPEAHALLRDARTAVLPAAAAALQDVRGSVLPEATAALRDVRAAAAGVQRLEAEGTALAREIAAVAGSLRGPAQTALASVRQALDDVRGLARQLKLAPDSLLFGVQRPAAPVGGDR